LHYIIPNTNEKCYSDIEQERLRAVVNNNNNDIGAKLPLMPKDATDTSNESTITIGKRPGSSIRHPILIVFRDVDGTLVHYPESSFHSTENNNTAAVLSKTQPLSKLLRASIRKPQVGSPSHSARDASRSQKSRLRTQRAQTIRYRWIIKDIKYHSESEQQQLQLQ
jgi:hypothetical protein